MQLTPKSRSASSALDDLRRAAASFNKTLHGTPARQAVPVKRQREGVHELMRSGELKMKSAFTLLAIVVALCITGCRDQTNQIPPDSFRATVRDLVEGNNLLVKHVIIEAPGEKTVKVTEKGGQSEATIEPAQNTNVMLAEVTFVAALVKTSESETMIKWLIQIKGQGVTAGRPSSFSVEAESLADVLQLKFDQEINPLGQDIVIGKFQGESIVLSVK